ncbi:hypothetical protein PFISCL1PPCAC_2517 [Pristionchus fissidentatus]|uniref:Cytoplasmic polyadenylation element-binding protein 1 n=1 Tax=Pristionchus fissidentatus TaxID=1538716 RepID=A0AAV5V080_9BILA|nr:hypothetical protein PFISCL1PPCAC_2517 [Pristionchus fissidentatus]
MDYLLNGPSSVLDRGMLGRPIAPAPPPSQDYRSAVISSMCRSVESLSLDSLGSVSMTPLTGERNPFGSTSISASSLAPSSFPATFSRKVFVGGLPADVNKDDVENLFRRFGDVLIDWPRVAQHPKERRTPRCSLNGYVFLVFQDEAAVHRLVRACTCDKTSLFLLISSATTRNKPAQVRPWLLSNIDYISPEFRAKDGSPLNIDPRKTVFVGGVPRPTTAEELATVLSAEFGPVAYVGIDIDPDLKYPKGAARVAFKALTGYLNAIRGKFVRIPHVDSNKKEVEVKAYVLDGQQCDECLGRKCDGRSAPYFCGDVSCLQYYCVTCWDDMHYSGQAIRAKHCPLVRLGDQTKAMNIVPHHVIPPSASGGLPSISLERQIDSLLFPVSAPLPTLVPAHRF